MQCVLNEISRVADSELVLALEGLVKADRKLGAKLLVHLGEVDDRKLYLALGFSTMFEYCRSSLGMSEAEAYLRVQAAKVGRRFPLVLERLGAGDVHLTAIKLLAPHLTEENHARLLDRVKRKSKRQIEVLIAELDPKPDIRERVRKLPAARTPVSGLLLAPREPVAAAAPSPTLALQSPQVAAAGVGRSATFALQSPRARASTAPLSPGRFKLELTLGQETHDKLEQLRELLRHQNPSGDLTSIIERAVSELLEREMKRRFAQTSTPKRRVAADRLRSRPNASADHEPVAASENPSRTSSSKSRYIPRHVLREVHTRDAGQCTFVSCEGRRCSARGFLEVHHHNTTFARGGAATADNLKLTCREHNMFLADQDYGRKFMQHKLREAITQRSRSRPRE
jgi:hypothetical protein